MITTAKICNQNKKIQDDMLKLKETQHRAIDEHHQDSHADDEHEQENHE